MNCNINKNIQFPQKKLQILQFHNKFWKKNEKNNLEETIFFIHLYFLLIVLEELNDD